jgi:hypothetical protein
MNEIQKLLAEHPEVVRKVIDICAKEARRYTLKTSGLSEDFGGVTNVEIEIRKLYEGSN